MKAVIVLALLLSQAAASATTIVVFRTPTSIVFATDAAAVGLDGGRRRATKVDCKILRAGRWWHLHGGFVQADGRDVRTLVSDAIATTTTMKEALARVDAVYRQRIAKLLTSKARLFAHRRIGEPVMVVLIGGLDGGTMTVGLFSVNIVGRTPFRAAAAATTCPGAACAGEGYFYAATQPSPVIDAFLNAPAPWFQEGSAGAARRFIAMQIEQTPQLAAHPIDVLELWPGGARWAGRPPGSACAAVP